MIMAGEQKNNDSAVKRERSAAVLVKPTYCYMSKKNSMASRFGILLLYFLKILLLGL